VVWRSRCRPLRADRPRAQVWEVGNRLLAATSPTSDEGFGTSLAVGDFDGDGIEDLAVGVPEATVGLNPGQGRADVFSAAPVFSADWP
jgi:hypothetical protein